MGYEMNQYDLSICILYLIGLIIDFVWLVYCDEQEGKKSIYRDCVNLLIAALWPLHLTLEVVMLLLVGLYRLVLLVAKKGVKPIIDVLGDFDGD